MGATGLGAMEQGQKAEPGDKAAHESGQEGLQSEQSHSTQNQQGTQQSASDTGTATFLASALNDDAYAGARAGMQD